MYSSLPAEMIMLLIWRWLERDGQGVSKGMGRVSDLTWRCILMDESSHLIDKLKGDVIYHKKSEMNIQYEVYSSNSEAVIGLSIDPVFFKYYT